MQNETGFAITRIRVSLRVERNTCTSLEIGGHGGNHSVGVALGTALRGTRLRRSRTVDRGSSGVPRLARRIWLGPGRRIWQWRALVQVVIKGIDCQNADNRRFRTRPDLESRREHNA